MPTATLREPSAETPSPAALYDEDAALADQVTRTMAELGALVGAGAPEAERAPLRAAINDAAARRVAISLALPAAEAAYQAEEAARLEAHRRDVEREAAARVADYVAAVRGAEAAALAWARDTFLPFVRDAEAALAVARGAHAAWTRAAEPASRIRFDERGDLAALPAERGGDFLHLADLLVKYAQAYGVRNAGERGAS